MRKNKTTRPIRPILEILESDYFDRTSHHVCMFCVNPLAKMRAGRLSPLGNKAHVTSKFNDGEIFVFNCCKDCASKVPQAVKADPKLLRNIFRTTQKLQASILDKAGRPELAKDIKAKAMNPPKLELGSVELDIHKRKDVNSTKTNESLKDKRTRLRAKKQKKD